MKAKLQLNSSAIINSYAQLFFSNSRVLAVLLLISSFTDPFVGTCGLFSLIVAVLFADWLGMNSEFIRNGTYGFNSLMVGLAMGVYYQLDTRLLFILIFISFFTLLLTVVIGGVLSKYNIPSLSLPFLIGIWVILLSVRTFTSIHLSERGIYTINELYGYGGNFLVNIYQKLNSISLPLFIDVYLKSIGGIFFQYNLVAGVLILIGLIFYSRIAFLLSLIGFATGYLFYYLLNGEFTQLQYSYIGFNFILTSVALGGFFLIPSHKSFLLTLIVTPVIAILLSGATALFSIYQLPVYSLPFNIAVMLVLFVLNNRAVSKNLDLVTLQQFTPEKNLYKYRNRVKRFKNDTYFHIHLPFTGCYYVSQGYNGSITHKGEWQHALDFVIRNEKGKTFRSTGIEVSDFYCYDLPVLAPAAGYVTTLADNIDDNAVGGVDLENNWGNTIVIKHADYFYSKLSHLKKGSFKVKIGDYVQKGDVLGACGNSGLSPEPHIHLQLQANPYIGSKTLNYPISYYVRKNNNKLSFHSFEVPQEGDTISNVETTKLLKNAFAFIAGEEFNFAVKTGDKETKNHWEIFTDSYNQSYIYCHTTRSTAYFVNDGMLFYFTDFYGDRTSLLYYFYLGAYKVLLGYYADIELKDRFPIEGFYYGVSKIIQDFIAPFYSYFSTNFYMKFSSIDNASQPGKIEITTGASAALGKHIVRTINYNIICSKNRLQSIIIRDGNQMITAECID